MNKANSENILEETLHIFIEHRMVYEIVFYFIFIFYKSRFKREGREK